MSYTLTIFCTRDSVPTLADLRDALNQPGYTLTSQTRTHVVPQDSNEWERAELRLRIRTIAICELEFAVGSVFPELQPFVQSLVRLMETRFGGSDSASRFVSHLKEAVLIVSISVPVTMEPDEDWPAIHALCNYFIDHNNGLLHAEGVGFLPRGGSTDVLLAVM